MAKGSSDQPTQTTTPILSPQQQEVLGLAMPGIRTFAANVPQRYQGEQVAGFNPTQQAAQQMLVGGAAPTQAGLAKSGADTSNFYTSGNIWDPSVNPNLQGAVNAAVRPITQNLTETQLPALRGEAVTTGNFGSSRQGIAEGLASGRASQAIGDTASKLVQNEYETNVNAQLRALGLLPQTIEAQTAAGRTTGAVGDVQQAQEQARINEAVSNFNFDQYAPFLQSQELLSLYGALPGGGTTSTGNVPKPNPFMQALGGAGSGAALGATLGSAVPGIGTLAGAGIGALGGAVLPFALR